MWQVLGPSKNVYSLPFVASKNWSGITKSPPGAKSCLRLPTALTLITALTPRAHKAQALALYGILCGGYLCPRPC